jgi:hypothetical protein
MSNPIRVATAALSRRIFAGRPTKDGLGFKEPRYDVTSDCLKAVVDKIGIGFQTDIMTGDEKVCTIKIVGPEAALPATSPVGMEDAQASGMHPSSNLEERCARMEVYREGWAMEKFHAGHTVSQRQWDDADMTEETREHYRRVVDVQAVALAARQAIGATS